MVRDGSIGLAKMWMVNLRNLERIYPRVAKKARENVRKWAGCEDEELSFIALAKELQRRRKKCPLLCGVSIALTYRNGNGSGVILFGDGTVLYEAEACFVGHKFVIYEGKEVTSEEELEILEVC